LVCNKDGNEYHCPFYHSHTHWKSILTQFFLPHKPGSKHPVCADIYSPLEVHNIIFPVLQIKPARHRAGMSKAKSFKGSLLLIQEGVAIL
jgi:hypothetical protein